MFQRNAVVTIFFLLILTENLMWTSSKEANKYLEHIFYKYGNQQGITFEVSDQIHIYIEYSI